MKMIIQTTDGDFVAHYSAHGLARLEFPGNPNGAEPTRSEPASVAQWRGWHALTMRALREALAGRTPRVLPPLDGVDFPSRVWNVLRRVAMGANRNETQPVAANASKGYALQAVGPARPVNARNSRLCHRVLPSTRQRSAYDRAA